MSGKTFPSSHVMSDDVDDIQDTRYDMRRRAFFYLLILCCICAGLHGPGRLYMVGMPPRAGVPLLPPRRRATDLGRCSNFPIGSARAPRVPRSREQEERPAAGENKMPIGENNTFVYI